jgi:hypothetical protein
VENLELARRTLVFAHYSDKTRQGNELRVTALAYQELAGVRIAIEDLAVSNFQIVADLADGASLNRLTVKSV